MEKPRDVKRVCRALAATGVVDNGSRDGSAELLAKIDAAGGCRIIPNQTNAMHGPALTQAMSSLAARGSGLPQWVWVLDSDVVISRPDALEAAVNRAEQTGAAIVGESWWDAWHETDRFLAYSLLIDPGDTMHPSHYWARDHHDPHFALVEGAAAMHNELMRAFRAEVGPLDEQRAVEALTRPERRS